MKGRKPKPTVVKLVTGNPGRRPLNKREPKPKPGLPTPPGHLMAEAKTEWRRVAKYLHAMGLLTALDRAAVAVYCQAYGRWVRAELALEAMAEKEPATQALLMKTKSGNLIQNPLVGVANKAMDMMLKRLFEMATRWV
jgi:P27 family predicted phage terminase small subunit